MTNNINQEKDHWAGVTPEPLPERLPPVEVFDLDMLPEQLKGWVDDISKRVPIAPDFAGTASMVVLSAIVGTQVQIRPKQQDNWSIVPNLWGAIIAPPSSLKSYILSEVMKPLSRREVELRKEYETEQKVWNASKRVRTQESKVIDAKIKQLIKDGKVEEAQKEALRLEEEEPVEPRRKRLTVNDTTVAKLGELLNENENGLMVYRDELTAFLNTLDKEGNESDKGFYLECWQGSGSFTYDRIGRGTVHIENTCVSILGGIQPDKISRYIRQISQNGDDGFIQRYQLVTFPDVGTGADWKYVDKKQDQDAVNKAFNMFKALGNIDINEIGASRDSKDGVPYLRFTQDAQELFVEWYTKLEKKLRNDNEDSIMLAHLSKYRSLVPSLALLIHLAENGIGGVERSALERACAWGEYLESHARRMYTPAISDDIDGAYILLKHIRQGKLKDPFTARDVRRKCWAGLRDMDKINQAITMLGEYKHVMVDDYKPSIGKPKKEIYINPKTLTD